MTKRVERRSKPRRKPESLTYARIYYRTKRGWIASDELLADMSASHLRVCADMPTASDFRLCMEDAEDFRRATVVRADGFGTVFEFGDPVEPPRSPKVVSDLSFLTPHYEFILGASGCQLATQ